MARYILVSHTTLRKNHNHLDLRFQIPGKTWWISFAIKSEIPTDPGKRIYIVRTTPHSTGAALFTGSISKGEYGAGSIKKIEEGNCDVLKFSDAAITVVFHGRKMVGKYFLINMSIMARDRSAKRKNIYAFFKAKNNNIIESYIQTLEFNGKISK